MFPLVVANAAFLCALLFLGLYILFRNAGRPANISLSLLTLLFAGMTACLYLLNGMTLESQEALMTLNLGYIIWMFIIPTFLYFCYYVANRTVPMVMRRLVAFTILASLVIIVSGSYYTDAQYSESSGYSVLTTPWGNMVEMLHLILAAAGVSVLRSAYIEDRSPAFREQIRTILAGGAILVATVFFFVYMTPLSDDGTYGRYFVPAVSGAATAMAGMWTFAVLRYQRTQERTLVEETDTELSDTVSDREPSREEPGKTETGLTGDKVSPESLLDLGLRDASDKVTDGDKVPEGEKEPEADKGPEADRQPEGEKGPDGGKEPEVPADKENDLVKVGLPEGQEAEKDGTVSADGRPEQQRAHLAGHRPRRLVKDREGGESREIQESRESCGRPHKIGRERVGGLLGR